MSQRLEQNKLSFVSSGIKPWYFTAPEKRPSDSSLPASDKSKYLLFFFYQKLSTLIQNALPAVEIVSRLFRLQLIVSIISIIAIISVVREHRCYLPLPFRIGRNRTRLEQTMQDRLPVVEQRSTATKSTESTKY